MPSPASTNLRHQSVDVLDRRIRLQGRVGRKPEYGELGSVDGLEIARERPTNPTRQEYGKVMVALTIDDHCGRDSRAPLLIRDRLDTNDVPCRSGLGAGDSLTAQSPAPKVIPDETGVLLVSTGHHAP